MNKIITAVVLAIPMISGAAFAQSETRVERECNKVFEEARRLPAPSPRSIYNYGTRVVNQGGRCVGAGIDAVTGRGGAQTAR